MNKNQDLYVLIDNPNGRGVPYFFGEEWLPSTPRNFHPRMNPRKYLFENKYLLHAKTRTFNADLTIRSNIASKKTIELMGELDISLTAIPLQINLQNQKSPLEGYYIYFLNDCMEILDRNLSIYVTDDGLRSKKQDFPYERFPEYMYKKIDYFVAKDDFFGHFFYCSEIDAPVCSNEFKGAFESIKLTGVKFIKLVDYKYKQFGVN